ncbi:c-type cytochrome [Acetobacter senegalensis]|uniref:c-type cytochrome n=1 Tax=Acetobacter senegalensis TaxID=446692 RepID=UPI001EDB7E91|nr:cytochrome c [Acetobacter senegalensis]
MRLRSLLPLLAGAVCVMQVANAQVPGEQAPVASGDNADLIKRGAYVAILGDCEACHTAHDGKFLAGGLALQSPLGAIYSTNITPDRDTGIGTWTYNDFARLMRRGIRKDGSSVYPAMPYPSYSKMTDEDLRALYAYLTKGVAPVSLKNRAPDIPWPLSMRWPLAIWRLIYASGPASASATSSHEQTRDALVERGRYLVEGPGHCGSCHTPRNIALAETAQTAAEGSKYLSGGFIVDNWVAPSLRSDDAGGLADWTDEDIVAFLKTGRNRHGATFGAMNGVVVHSTAQTEDRDLAAIAAFLKTLGPPPGVPARMFRYDDSVSRQLFAGETPTNSARIYVDRCAACHRTDGRGYAGVFPPLAGNPVLQGPDATSVAHIILTGGRLPGVADAPSSLVMGSYRDVLDDQQIADLVTFLGQSWGNRGAAVTASQVAKIRLATKGQKMPAGE